MAINPFLVNCQKVVVAASYGSESAEKSKYISLCTYYVCLECLCSACCCQQVRRNLNIAQIMMISIFVDNVICMSLTPTGFRLRSDSGKNSIRTLTKQLFRSCLGKGGDNLPHALALIHQKLGVALKETSPG